MNWKRSSLLRQLLTALLVIAGASMIRASLFSDIGRELPYVIYYPAVMLAALSGGMAAGFLATTLSAVLCYFWIQKGHLSATEWLGMLIFLIGCTMVSAVCEVLLRTQARAKLAQTKTEAANQDLHKEIAERQQTEEELRKSEERFRRAVIEAPFPIMLHAEDGAVQQVSNSWCEITGYSREELATTADWTERAYGSRKELVRADIEAIYGLEHRKYQGDYSIHTKTDGTRIWEFSSAPLGRLPDGRRLAISMAQDVTERRRAEAALRENQQMLQNILDQFPGGVFWKDAQSNYLGCNHAFAIGAGFKEPADIIGKNDFDLALSATEAEQYQADDAAVTASGQARLHIIETLHQSDGRVIWLDTSKIPLRDLTGKIVGVLGVTTDVTERKLAEETIRRERDFSQTALDSLPGLFYLFDEAGWFLRVNRNFERVSGYSAEELSRMTPLELFDGPDKQRIAEAIRQARESGEVTVEADFIAKDKTRTPYFFTGKLFNFDRKSCVMGMGIDITERRLAEEKIKLTVADLERSNTELEHFAYVASHDLQEPLRMVASYTQLLAQRYETQLDDKAKKYIHYAVDGAMRMQTLIIDLLTYSRAGRRGKPLELTDPHAVLGEAIRNLAATIGETHAVITNDELPMVWADPSQLALVFQNLLANAIKFRRAELPRIHVSARDQNGEWQFAVKDNGIGIAAQYAERVFLIFQRLHTREEYPGTGIGLAVCKRIVERHGGKIWFESKPGTGTTFFFTISATPPKPSTDHQTPHEIH